MAKLSIMGPAASASAGPLSITPQPAPESSNILQKVLGNPAAVWNRDPTKNVAANIIQGISSRIASIGLTAQNKVLSLIQPRSVQPTIQIPDYLHPLLGVEPISDIPTAAAAKAAKISANPVAQKYGLDKHADALSYGLLAAGTTLDLAGLGGEKAALQAIVKEKGIPGATALLREMGINADTAQKYAPDAAAAKTTTEAGHVLEVAKGTHGLSILSDKEKSAMELYDKYRNPNLSEGLKGIEQDSFGHIQSSGGVEKMADAYTQQFGNVVNTDNARELFPAYAADRTRAAAVHEPASVITKAAYDKLLKERVGQGDGTVLFTGGGTGAGKSSALNAVGGMAEKASIVYDGNLSSLKPSIKKIDKALAAGYKADLVYVYRHPVDALVNGALARAERMAAEKGSGRTVPLNEHLNTHFGTPRTALALMEHYKGNPDVSIRAIDNSLGAGNAVPVEPLDFFKGKVYTKGNEKEISRKAAKALEAEYQAGRISEATYAGSKDVPGKKSRPNAGDGGRPQPGTPEARAITPAHSIQEITKGPDGKSWSSLIKNFNRSMKPAEKVHALDYMGTPEFVLEKVGLGKAAEKLQDAKLAYRKTLKKEIDRIEGWKKEIGNTPYASTRIFRYLDGKAKFVKSEMTPGELKVAAEIKSYLDEWANRLKLPEDNRLSNYITHIFEERPGADLKPTVFEDDPELAAIMQKTPAGSVYDPFLQRRTNAQNYKEDVWAALDAYVKRGSRKEAMDPALEYLKNEAKKLDESTFNYITRLSHRINMRPTEMDKLVDNFIKATPGLNRIAKGPRPTMFLTQKIRNMFYRGTLGINFSSALRNLSQGANTYAKLGEKYTVIGYAKLFKRLLTNNLKDLHEAGVLDEELVQDKKIGVYKSVLQKLDPVLYSVFSLAERINRGAAYYGAEAKALKQGLSPEQAMKYGARIVRETQFAFGNIDSPVALSSDIIKTATQLGTYNIKQIEFLSRLAKDKEFGGLIRYSLASLAFVATIGKAFGMTVGQLIPSVGLGGSPVGNLLTGLGELMSTNSETRAKGKSDLTRAAVSIIPGGAQIRKTVQGIEAYQKGRDTTPTGRTRFKVPQDTKTQLQTAIFGKSAIPEARAYYDSLGKKKAPSKSKLTI